MKYKYIHRCPIKSSNKYNTSVKYRYIMAIRQDSVFFIMLKCSYQQQLAEILVTSSTQHITHYTEIHKGNKILQHGAVVKVYW